jgi:tellurite resistance protein
MARTTRRAPGSAARLTVDQAIIAVLIAAMHANEQMSAEEAARAHHMIWSMRRFRRRDGEAVNRLIGTTRALIEERGWVVVLAQAARAVPARLRPTVYAIAVDLMLADATLEPAERRFVMRLANELHVDPALARDILRVLLIKNGG